MQIVNLSREDIVYGLKSPAIHGEFEGDYYRKFTEFDKDNILGLYFKDLMLDYPCETLDSRIETLKTCADAEYTWEHYKITELFSLVNRLEDFYATIKDTTKLKSPEITGIALYKNYPVGTLFPRKLLSYKNYVDLVKDNNLDRETKILILNRVKELAKILMRNSIYPVHLCASNGVVNERNYNDIRFAGLDGPMITRIETKQYVRELSEKGYDLGNKVFKSIRQLKQI